MSQPKRTLALIEAAERSKKTPIKVSVSHEGEQFVYQGGELREYSHPVVKRLVQR